MLSTSNMHEVTKGTLKQSRTGEGSREGPIDVWKLTLEGPNGKLELAFWGPYDGSAVDLKIVSGRRIRETVREQKSYHGTLPRMNPTETPGR